MKLNKILNYLITIYNQYSKDNKNDLNSNPKMLVNISVRVLFFITINFILNNK